MTKKIEPENAAAELLDTDTSETVRLSVAEATAIGERALQRVGYSGEHARIIVDQLVDNALSGYRFAGLHAYPVSSKSGCTRKVRLLRPAPCFS